MSDFLARAPFNLDKASRDWVDETIARMTPEEKAGQLFNLMVMGDDPSTDRLKALKVGGITRAFGRSREAEIAFMDQVRADAEIPLLISGDLEGSLMSLAFGTEVPNPLALAAVNDTDATERIAGIMAREARAIGLNWTFSPVLDVNAKFRSPIVPTRGFGADPALIERQTLAMIRGFQQNGLAATAKHWPGEGHDDRDQHLVTTAIPLSLEQWEETHGRLYRAAIKAGVASVMSAHIAFPQFVRLFDPDATLEAYRPAVVSRLLNEELLRNRLGFNGLIVTDATPMAGFGAWGPRRDMLPEAIENGCDMILFALDPEGEVALVRDAIVSGRISPQRVNDALRRVLGLKAMLGLHRAPFVPAREQLAEFARPEDVALARSVTERAPTLVKDVQNLLPISPETHRRVLVVTGDIVIPFSPDPIPLAFPDMLRNAGFEVTRHRRGEMIDPAKYDLVLIAIAEESLLLRGRIFLDWHRLMGGIDPTMQRTWHEVPTALISFGYPYLLCDAPRMPCAINAYAAMPSMQQAVVDALLGKIPFNRFSPIDPFCGLEDAQW